MKAMILAAGLGTRLKPLTNTTPKALMAIGNKTMLEMVSERLIQAGVTEIIINVHHHAEQMKSFIDQMNYPGVAFYVSDETDQLLDTGGGIKKARDFLDGNEAFFVHNIDIISDIDLKAMLNVHNNSDALATLAISKRKGYRYFLWDHAFLYGWQNTKTGATILCGDPYNTTGESVSLPKSPTTTASEKRSSDLRVKAPPFSLKSSRDPHQNIHNDIKRRAFSGIHIIEPCIFDLMTETGVFSITDVYLRLAASHRITNFEHDHRHWFDIGTPENLAQARERYADK